MRVLFHGVFALYAQPPLSPSLLRCLRLLRLRLRHSYAKLWACAPVLGVACRISAGRDELGQWAIEPCELHRVYPPLTDDTGTENGTEERGVTGGETAVAEA